MFRSVASSIRSWAWTLWGKDTNQVTSHPVQSLEKLLRVTSRDSRPELSVSHEAELLVEDADRNSQKLSRNSKKFTRGIPTPPLSSSGSEMSLNRQSHCSAGTDWTDWRENTMFLPCIQTEAQPQLHFTLMQDSWRHVCPSTVMQHCWRQFSSALCPLLMPVLLPVKLYRYKQLTHNRL